MDWAKPRKAAWAMRFERRLGVGYWGNGRHRWLQHA